ncbi:hypothetical protein M9Y10_025646 [Tritrichomonas musculus]|uniref:FMP27 GFWDK domain-containing protein n=1 Tax=Tritrichomonas musculus TaxID=1915356 RepID=A0ABR2HA87_9EUKA
MLLIAQLACFFLIFVIIYIILRAILIYAIYLFLTRIFNAKVRFKSGYSFFSIQDITVESDQFEIQCKLFMISVGVHTSMQLKNLLIKKGNIHYFKEVYLNAQRIVDRALPSKRFFHISIDVDNVNYQTENFLLTMDNIRSIHTDSQHSLSFQNCNFTNPLLSIKVSEYEHSIHFSGNLPEKIQIMRPIFNIKCNGNTISSDQVEISAYSEIPSIWRTVISLREVELTFPHITFLDDIFIIKFSHQINFSIVDSLITFESLHIKNYLHQFKIKINHVKLSHDKIKVKKIIGNSNVQFLRILNHLRWLLYASCKINKTELLIKLENGELLDIVVLNFEERNKLDDNESNDRRPSELNLDSEAANFQYLNIFNSYFNSFNKHNIKLSEGEALITNPSEIANGFHSSNFYDHLNNYIFERPKKEFVKADEVKMEMIAHRTLISSAHMSDVQINRKDVSQFTLNSLNIIYSNSETFQLYLQELYEGFSGKLTAKEHNIKAFVNFLRIDELILNRTLTSENLDLDLKINKSVPLEESRKSLKSLFPKLADLSKIQSVILLNYNIKCSEMNFTQTFSVTPIKLSGTMAFFHNGTKMLTCGVVHCISDTATLPLETFYSPAFWYISFEMNTMKIKYEQKKAIFKGIKGESTSFTFESATLFKDIVQLKKIKKANGEANNNNNNNNDEDPLLVEDKNISIFDFWTENVIPIGPERKLKTSPSNASSATFEAVNENSNSASFETEVNLATDTNLNLTTISNLNMNPSIQKPLKRKNSSTRLNRYASQFDFEDSVFRPSQHQDSQSFYGSYEKLPTVQNRKTRQPYKIILPPTDQVRNSIHISPKLTSEYVPGSLFESSASLANLFSNASSNIAKKSPIKSSLDKNNNSETDQNRSDSPLVLDQLKRIDSTRNISIAELKNDQPSYEQVRYKLECFNGEYFTNAKDRTVEFKAEKAIFGDVQYTNVTSRFEKDVPVTFTADQIEWPYMKAFFTEFNLTNRLFKAKSMSLNSNFSLTSFDPKWLSFSRAEIGQILFKSFCFDLNTIKNPYYQQNSNLSRNKSIDSNLNQNKSIDSNMNSKMDFFIESKVISMTSGKFSFKALDVNIPIYPSKSELTAGLIRVAFSTISSFISFLRDFNTQFKKVNSPKIILKLKPMNIAHASYSNHSIVFKDAEFNFILDHVNVFDITSKFVAIFRVEKKVPTSKIEKNISKKIEIDGDKKDKINNKKEIFLAKPNNERVKKDTNNNDDKQQLHIILTFKEKENVCKRLNISLNSIVVLKCDHRDAQLFKENFRSVFQVHPHEEVKKYLFESTSFFNFILLLNYYDPKDPDFDENREYKLNMEGVEIPKQTNSFHDMIDYIFDYVMKIVRGKVQAIKKREVQPNGNNYS